ncbi:MAG: hypothetical protein U0821_17785 [Chloroflexota bacterium]
MKALGRYDGTLQMFVVDAPEIDMTRIAFLRWLGENGRLEHETFGPPSGDLTREQPTELVVSESLPVAA